MFQAHELVDIKPNPKVQNFRSGDNVKVGIRVKEGDRVRTQVFEGVVIRKRGGGPSATFTVRRVASGVGVERTFHLHSPVVEYVEVLRKGAVKQARLYYLRGLTGKKARIKEKRFIADKSVAPAVSAETVTEQSAEEATIAAEPQIEEAVVEAVEPIVEEQETKAEVAAEPEAVVEEPKDESKSES